ncbi:MAG: hypothetical protein HKP61_01065 [Dactylosporangium sp.]|nr:hypothetical protein [Dactylosporangium sp.]NNJ59561.1 hypothetical protein [Dactylosporangium sp.]
MGVSTEYTCGCAAEVAALRRDVTVLRAEVARLAGLVTDSGPSVGAVLVGVEPAVPIEAPPRSVASALPQAQPTVESVTLTPAAAASTDRDRVAARRVALYRSLFAGRQDVYAARWERDDGRKGWSPQVDREPGQTWKEANAARRYRPLTDAVLHDHLSGKITAGRYPMLPDDTCQLLACDFDGDQWQLDAQAYAQAADDLGIPAAVEVSRSGDGAHVWVFFAEPVTALDARALGFALLREAMATRGELGLDSYDRLFPSQDHLPITGEGLGNLIALPLQKRCRDAGTTVFVDPETCIPQWHAGTDVGRRGPPVRRPPAHRVPGLDRRAHPRRSRGRRRRGGAGGPGRHRPSRRAFCGRRRPASRPCPAPGRPGWCAGRQPHRQAYPPHPTRPRLLALVTAAQTADALAATLSAEADRAGTEPDRLTCELLLLDGRVDATADRLGASDPLGWSRPTHPGPVVWPYPLVASASVALDKTTHLGRLFAAIDTADRWYGGYSDDLNLDLADDQADDQADDLTRADRPQARKLALTTLLARSSREHPGTPAQRQRWLTVARHAADQRIDAVVGNKYRGAYQRVAVLAVAHAESLTLAGDPSGATAHVAGVRARYPRHTAFRTELDRATVASPLLPAPPARGR